MIFGKHFGGVLAALLFVGHPVPSFAQAPATSAEPSPPLQHDHSTMQRGGWRFMQDGVVFVTFDHQGGGSRGGSEVGSQNWWMGMAQRGLGPGALQIDLMLSLEPATVGDDGYRQLFQTGETLNGRPLVDRQHPHDFLMQAAAVWRVPLGTRYGLTLAGAPVGEPALGPVAFMHRASAFENSSAPMAHHTLDSTHIAMGVITAGLDRGPWQIEGSVFHGAEPDEQRWDLMDAGALDSWSVRGWYRPARAWTLQASHGFLHDPEASEPADVRRTTASASWLRRSQGSWTAVTFAYGRNNEPGADFNAGLVEATHAFGRHTTYGRLEAVQMEADLVRCGLHGFVGGRKAARHVPDDAGGVTTVIAATLGGTRTLLNRGGWDFAAGADVVAYRIADLLKPLYGNHPLSFHLFVRLRPPAPNGRMTDMVMSRIAHGDDSDDHKHDE